MDNKKKSRKPTEKDSGKILMGKKHEDNRQNSDKEKLNENNNRISDNPGQTERKMPTMKH